MFLQFDTRLFIGIGRNLTQGVNAAMDIGIVPRIVIDNSIDHNLRCLTRGRIVKIRQWFAIYLLFQYGEVRSYFLNV